jgi:TM2 domain-containing membrane protein YozV
MKCGNCGLVNVQTARFCVRCGVPIAAAAQPGVPYAPAPQATAFAPPPVRDEITQPYAMPAQHGVYPQAPIPTQRGMQHHPAYPQQAGGNPVLALFMSLIIPGLGQFYNSDTKKGLVMLGVALFGSWLVLPWLGMAIWGAIDAWQVASGTGRRWV